MDTPFYRSFLVRLWHEPAAPGSWRGEVESIQSGSTVTGESLDATLEIIRLAVGNSHSSAVPTPAANQVSTDIKGANR